MPEPNVVQIQDRAQSRPDTEPVTFDDFWLLYPRHVAKLAARKAWDRLGPDDQLAAIIAAEVWRRVWRDKDPEFIPHGATWLNGRRFEDEPPAGFTNRPTQTAQIAPTGVDHQVQAREPMPDHVRALIGRLKARL